MALNIENHPSPNQNSRGGVRVRAVIMHATAGTNSLGHLTNPAPGGNPAKAVSAHDLIAKNGTVFHLVNYDRRAWHAGRSHLPPFPQDVNSLSIGIELENLNDGHDPYPDAQWAAAVELVQGFVKDFQILRPFVVTHEFVAPGRKFDPRGPAFDIERFRTDVYGAGGAHATATMVATTDDLNIRVGANSGTPSNGQLSQGERVEVDRMVLGEDIEGEPSWAHLADGRGFVTMRFLRSP